MSYSKDSLGTWSKSHLCSGEQFPIASNGRQLPVKTAVRQSLGQSILVRGSELQRSVGQKQWTVIRANFTRPSCVSGLPPASNSSFHHPLIPGDWCFDGAETHNAVSCSCISFIPLSLVTSRRDSCAALSCFNIDLCLVLSSWNLLLSRDWGVKVKGLRSRLAVKVWACGVCTRLHAAFRKLSEYVPFW